jgi:hypothetical protein
MGDHGACVYIAAAVAAAAVCTVVGYYHAPTHQPARPPPRLYSHRRCAASSQVWTTLLACCHALDVVASTRPKLVLVNGPGTCLPLCLAAVALETLCLLGRVRIV